MRHASYVLSEACWAPLWHSWFRAVRLTPLHCKTLKKSSAQNDCTTDLVTADQHVHTQQNTRVSTIT
jgi:hypothetical protein